MFQGEMATQLQWRGLEEEGKSSLQFASDCQSKAIQFSISPTDGRSSQHRVGMSENEARKQGRNIRVAKLPMNAVPRALETGETRGFMKAIVDTDIQHILGCAILGVEGGEIMTIIQVAMMGKLPYTAL